jgi:drug/metabolite transporter (DMT)-like permease
MGLRSQPPDPPPARLHASSHLDALLLLMAIIWGTNYALVKSAFRDLDPQAFNALRLVLASTVMAGASRLVRRSDVFHTTARVTPVDWIRLVWLGLIGHCLYQFLFVGGLARTSVANSALIISATPVVITVFSAIGGKERIGATHWAGTLLSVLGIYIIVGRGARISGASIHGDVMLMAADVCWALYTIGARPLMQRHSPVGVTALSMLLGTMVYVPLSAAKLAHVPWGLVPISTWIKLVYSAIFAICVCYTIWYAAVRSIGSARTSVFSNLLPIIAMITAHFWQGEAVGLEKVGGAAAVLAGVALTRAAAGRGHETIEAQ